MIVEKSLTSAQRDDLRVISGMMIPESDEYKVPGADDAAIQGDILATLGRDTKMVAAALDHIAKLAGKPLASLDETRREAVVTEFRASGGAPVPCSPASSCNATTATTACCARSASNCARHSRKGMCCPTATGRSSIP